MALAMVAVILSGCTKPSTSSSSKVSFQLPAASSAAVYKTSDKISASGVGDWGLSDPVNAGEINCYSVAVAIPKSDLPAGTCQGADKTTILQANMLKGGFAAGSSVALEIPSGSARTISLFGFKAVNGRCTDFEISFSRRYLSRPLLIASATVDLVPGDQAITLNASLTSSQAIDSCPNMAIDFTTARGGIDKALVLAKPAAGDVYGGSTIAAVPFTGTCKNDGDVVAIFADDASVGSASCASGAFSGTLDLSTKANGPVLLMAQSTGLSGLLRSDAVAVTKDTVGPTLTLTSASGSPTSANPIHFIIAVSKSGASFDAAKMSVSNGTPAGAVTGSGTSYAVDITPTGAGNVTLSLGAGAVLDALGNLSAAAIPLVVVYNPGAPTVTLSSAVASPTSISPIAITATFSQPVTGLTTSGFSVTNGTVSGLTGSGASYSFNVIPGANGAVSVSILPGAAVNGALTQNTASNSLSWIYDNVAPIFPAAITSNYLVYGSLTTSPPFNFNATDTGGSGIATYAAAVGSSTGGTDILYWTSIGNVATAQMTSLALLPGHTYYFTLRAYDAAGNMGQSLSISWVAQGSRIATGDAHSCVSSASGQVKCWGKNSAGQLGNSTFVASLTPVFVSGLATSAQVFAGENTSCSLNTNGSTSCWGANANYQLLDGTVTSRNSVTASTFGSGVLSLSVGLANNCVVLASGQAQCWGDNSVGQVGDNTVVNRSTPVTVSGLASNAALISMNRTHACALTTGGGVMCWGDNPYGEIGDNTVVQKKVATSVIGFASSGAIHVASGGSHSCLVTSGGTVKCWGLGTSGQLGNSTYSNSLSPVAVTGLTNIGMVTAGAGHACALSMAGQVSCWGDGQYGQLGVGSVAPSSSPIAVTLPAAALSIASYRNHTCAYLTNSTVSCWGMDHYGQLGDSAPTYYLTAKPAANGVGSITQVSGAMNGYSTCVISAGSLGCFGDNASAQLGDGTTAPHATAAIVTGLSSGVTSASVGSNFACAVVSGLVKCWGNNSFGQLGDSTVTSRTTPVQVVSLTSAATKVVAGVQHTCAVKAGGVYCWGGNSSGQLGNNTTTSASVPYNVGYSVAVDIALGINHSCALLNDGTVTCWGGNASGQLGIGNLVNQLIPYVLPSLGAGSGVTQLTAGLTHTCALKSNGTVTGITNAVAVAAGTAHTCAVLSDGTVKCWGQGVGGRLGDGTADVDAYQSLVPVTVGGVTTATAALSVGYTHSCVVVAGGSLSCWGSNLYGQLGNAYALTPIGVTGAP
jgi:alpha-tubulin suppressor-like RCC1 family protein